MAEYYPAMVAVLAVELAQSSPALEYRPEEDEPTLQREPPAATTSRERGMGFISEHDRDFHGRSFQDLYITAPVVADILGVSNDTARRRLEYFEEQGILKFVSDARAKHYVLEPEYSGVEDERVRSAPVIVEKARELLEAAED